MSDDLAVFLRARLDEREQALRLLDGARVSDPFPEFLRGHVTLIMEGGEYPAAETTFRELLADIESKRQVIGLLAIAERHLHEVRRTAPEYRLVQAAEAPRDALLLAVQHLATPYAEHPSYRVEWRP
jgi:hypothetical protein